MIKHLRSFLILSLVGVLMKAVAFSEYGSAEVLQLVEQPIPSPKNEEILIKVNASSLNPLDIKLRKGDMKLFYPSKFPKILGFDVSGEIVEVGKNVTDYKIGDDVFGLLDIKADGANAEYVITKKHNIIHKPTNLTHIEAASFPVTGLTAIKSLITYGKIKEGSNVLVVGASGGVGSIAVQIAKAYGANVTGICSQRNVDFVSDLGADKIISYDKDGFQADQLFDVIFDATGLYRFSTLSKYLTKSGVFVSTLPRLHNMLSGLSLSVLSLFGNKRKVHAVIVKPDVEGLKILKDLIEAGSIKPTVHKTFTLDELKVAHNYLENEKSRGKIAITI